MRPKKPRSIFWHLKDKLNDAAMFHKKIIKKFQKKFNLTNYQVVWLSFAEGVIIGIIFL